VYRKKRHSAIEGSSGEFPINKAIREVLAATLATLAKLVAPLFLRKRG
jgi:hypothetical protein